MRKLKQKAGIVGGWGSWRPSEERGECKKKLRRGAPKESIVGRATGTRLTLTWQRRGERRAEGGNAAANDGDGDEGGSDDDDEDDDDDDIACRD